MSKNLKQIILIRDFLNIQPFQNGRNVAEPLNITFPTIQFRKKFNHVKKRNKIDFFKPT